MAQKHTKEIYEARLKRLKENQKDNYKICLKLERLIRGLEK